MRVIIFLLLAITPYTIAEEEPKREKVLMWDEVTEASYYIVHCGAEPVAYTVTKQATNTPLSLLLDGEKHYCAVVACDQSHQCSDYSNEVEIPGGCF